jgi:hypothetical protein
MAGILLSFLLLVWLPTLLFAAAPLPDQAALRAWIEEMKASPKGPFFRIRWFCHDGTVLPPRPYGCKEHGGGRQHGEWNERTKQLRAAGYHIANVLADLDVPAFLKQPDHASVFKQMVLEQFLMAVDNGWILRQARFYRGALQAEGESAAARRLLLGLLQDATWVTQGFMPLRMGARLLPHGQQTSSAAAVRQQATTLSMQDPGFMRLRNKIHAKPDGDDAARVRQYAATVSNAALKADYERLASNIDTIYTAAALPQSIGHLVQRLAGHTALAQTIQDGTARLAATQDPASRFAVTGQLMATLREHLPQIRKTEIRLLALDTNLALEAEHFVMATALRARLPQSSRRQRLTWLHESIDALYGAGLLSARERQALRDAFTRLAGDEIPLRTYKAELDYLGRVPGWSERWLRFHFAPTIEKFTAIEPLAALFSQDQLRGSPLFFYAHVLDSLLQDANQLVGVHQQLFGQEIGTGLRSLNPGLARGILHRAPEDGTGFDPNGIYLLPETTSELPPVAGILTAGEGNPLSHVQLLARNLGIPNVGVDATLVPQLLARTGKRVILAVSPAGSVQLSEDSGQWNEIVGQESSAADMLIRPDLTKLDLHDRQLVPTSQLRASDSGRTVGPKAANLGELAYHYPDQVAPGLAIPFGVFRHLLTQPLDGAGQDVFTWMVEQYAALRTLPKGSTQRATTTEALRQRLQQWILQADPDRVFRQQLRTAMAQVFGEDGTYGVFVRSDTNVEDLPGFTGAGLNLTVPHVVGFDRVLQALAQVWASPFSQRAYAWRQSHMAQPEHVYPAVLLMRSVPVEKSGVMVTQDIDTGESGWLSVAVNEGIGGAVDGQAAESLRIHLASGSVRLLAQATVATQRVLNLHGGIDHVPVSGADRVLHAHEIAQLIQLAQDLPNQFPMLKDAAGNPAPADIEFGFLQGELKLFQIRPFLESVRARRSSFLHAMDRDIHKQATTRVAMQAIPKGSVP